MLPSNTILERTYLVLIMTVFSLSIIALIAELMPEVKAKIIVIPTLILIIILCVFEIKERFTYKNFS